MRRIRKASVNYATEIAAREADVATWEGALRLAKTGNSANAAIGAFARLEVARRLLHRTRIMAADEEGGQEEVDRLRRDRTWAAQDGAWAAVAALDKRIADELARIETERKAEEEARRRGQGGTELEDRVYEMLIRFAPDVRTRLLTRLADDTAPAN